MIELFDFVKIIDSSLSFSGKFEKNRIYINVHLEKDYNHFETSIDDEKFLRSVFGRSDSGDMDEALSDLARCLSNTKIKNSKITLNVPSLTHTRGYRGILS